MRLHMKTHDNSDNDKKNALSNLRNVQSGSKNKSTPTVSTEDVISLLLQRQIHVLNRNNDEKDSSLKEQQQLIINVKKYYLS